MRDFILMKLAAATVMTLKKRFHFSGENRQLDISPLPFTNAGIRLRWIGAPAQNTVENSFSSRSPQVEHKGTHRHISTTRYISHERMMRNCPDIMCTVGRDGKFISINEACSDIWGYSPAEIEGRHFTEFLLPEDVKKTAETAYALMNGGGKTGFENRYMHKDGTVIPMQWAVRWSEEDQALYAVGRDATDIRSAEVAQLELRIKERTCQLEQSMKELEAFSYSVSHDLRAPLRIINGYTKLLSNEYNDKMNDDGKEFISEIIANTKYMGRLIDDLLNLSRLGGEAIKTTQVDMTAIVRIVQHEMKMDDSTINADITIHDLKPCVCDQPLIRQVWINLISNAIKYSKKKGQPKIEIGSYDKGNDTVYYIKDNGAGFDMKFAAKLFGVFIRLHDRSEFDGTGVGLALVHRIITKHGGKVWANGKVDEGAVFYFSLPK